MQQFDPTITIAGISDTHILVFFDTSCVYDAARSPKGVLIAKNFGQIELKVEGFLDMPDSHVAGQKLFKGRVLLRSTSSDGAEHEQVLAEPELWITGTGPHRKGPVYIFPSADDIKLLVDQGVASAFADAFMVYSDDENQRYRDSLGVAASGASNSPAPASASVGPTARQMRAGNAGARGGRVAKGSQAASNSSLGWKRIVALGAGSVVFVWLFCAFVLGTGVPGAAKPPVDTAVQTAVSQNFAQNPAAMQAQVELTKETLKQMGLDPGKSGDVGCLAPQQ